MEKFFQTGYRIDTAYLFISGTVKVYCITENGEEIMLDTNGSGEFVGEMPLPDEKPCSLKS